MTVSPAPSRLWSRPHGLVVFGFSLGLLLTELCLTRVLSVFFFYHTAFFAVSLAMLGLGIGGVWVYLFPQQMRRGPHLAMTLTGLGVLGLPIVLSQLRFNHTLLRTLWSAEFVWIFGIVAVCCLIPFLAGGLALAWWFQNHRQHIASLYAWDLLGAACGALCLVPLMNAMGGPAALLCCGIWLLLMALGYALQQQVLSWSLVALCLTLGGTCLLFFQQTTDTFALQVDVDATQKTPPKVLYKQWNAFSRVVVLDHQNWFRAISPNRWEFWKGKIPKHLHALIDINAFAPFLQFDGDLRKVAYLKELVSNIAYHLLPTQQRVLILGPGGNKDILGALLFAPQQVTGIELNPILVHDLAQNQLRHFTGDLYKDPKIRMLVGDGRSVLQHLPPNETFDVILANSVATWAAHSSGAMNLAEHSLYTQEACGLYLDRLSARGILSVSLWDVNQHALPLRWLRTCEKAARLRGMVSWHTHVAVLANRWDQRSHFATILISRTPFTSTQRNTLVSIATSWQYAPFYIPGYPHNQQAFEQYFRAPNHTIHTFPYNISAATDDRPFFLYTVRWQEVFSLWKKQLWEEDAAMVNLLLSLLVVSLLLVALIGGPLLWHTFYQPQTRILSGADLLYFFAIGWGFMLVEIPFIQRLTLWLGHPTYALTVVLAAILLYSGIGSAFVAIYTRRKQISPSFAWMGLGALTVCLLLLFGSLDAILHHTAHTSLVGRIAIALLLLAIPGFLMGFPLPLGMSRLQIHNPTGIAWAWGINGASSVVASVAALGLAVILGFNLVLLLAALCYALAVFIVLTFW